MFIRGRLDLFMLENKTFFLYSEVYYKIINNAKFVTIC